MQIFISWSGERSRQVAEAIRAWLPKVIQSVKPWMSDQDIAAGSRWLTEVAGTLNATNVGLICVTPENQHNPWLVFEAGALSRTLEQTCVCPVVFDMTPGQLTGPLTQFQANSVDREGIGKVLSTINKNLGDRMLDAQQLNEILDVWWPKLNEKLEAIHPAPSPTPARATNDQLEELLALARENLRRENIRLEAARERDEKIDSVFDFMDKATTALRGQALRLQAVMSNSAESGALPLHDGTNPHATELVQGIASAVIPGQLDLAAMGELTEVMRAMRERDKERLNQILTTRASGDRTA